MKREQAYECVRKEAIRRGLQELDRQLEYKKEQAGVQAMIQAREIAENMKILQEMEDQQRSGKLKQNGIVKNSLKCLERVPVSNIPNSAGRSSRIVIFKSSLA